MAYSKTTWVDRIVQFPRRFIKSQETGNSVTLIPDPGTVTQEGTMVSAALMNKIEQGIADAHAILDSGVMNKIAKYKNPDGTEIDPNTTTDTFIITAHANCPDNTGYFYVLTYFSGSVGGNRAQVAHKYYGQDIMYYRQNFNGEWTAWKRVADFTTHQQRFRVTGDNGWSKNLVEGTDLNDISTAGFYDGRNLVNAPASTAPDGSGWFYYLVIPHSANGTGWTKQLAFEFGANKTWIRTKVSGTWTPWREIPVLGGNGIALSGVSVFVDGINGNDSNTGTSGAPVKTLKKAISLLPKICSGTRTVYFLSGTSSTTTYAEDVDVEGFVGGTIEFLGVGSYPPTLRSLYFEECYGCRIRFNDITFRTDVTYQQPLIAINCPGSRFDFNECSVNGTVAGGMVFHDVPEIYVQNTIFGKSGTTKMDFGISVTRGKLYVGTSVSENSNSVTIGVKAVQAVVIGWVTFGTTSYSFDTVVYVDTGILAPS